MPKYLTTPIAPDAVWGTFEDVERRNRISRSQQYELIAGKKIIAKKQGSRTIINLPSVDAYQANLPDAEIKPPPVPKKAGAS
jgi:hypothetical protein